MLISLFVSGRCCLKNTVLTSSVGECLKQFLGVCSNFPENV